MLNRFINFVGPVAYIFPIWMMSITYVLVGIVFASPYIIPFTDLSPFLLIIPLVALYFVNAFLMWVLAPYEYLVTSALVHFFLQLSQLMIVFLMAVLYSPFVMFIYAFGLYWYLDNYPTDAVISEVGVTNKVINGT